MTLDNVDEVLKYVTEALQLQLEQEDQAKVTEEKVEDVFQESVEEIVVVAANESAQEPLVQPELTIPSIVVLEHLFVSDQALQVIYSSKPTL